MTAKSEPDAMGIQMGGDGGQLYLTNSDGDFTIVNPATPPPGARTLELSDMPSSYSHPVLTSYGLCLPFHGGVLMVKLTLVNVPVRVPALMIVN